MLTRLAAPRRAGVLVLAAIAGPPAETDAVLSTPQDAMKSVWQVKRLVIE